MKSTVNKKAPKVTKYNMKKNFMKESTTSKKSPVGSLSRKRLTN
jgi:hypothetical protein